MLVLKVILIPLTICFRRSLVSSLRHGVLRRLSRSISTELIITSHSIPLRRISHSSRSFVFRIMKRHRNKHRAVDDVYTIVVHAGAGYHSVANQDLHLMACSDACKAGMAVLRAGGTAVDAVEIAVKVLEDREITNAGYGSNLAMDGVVECDALIVDHMGRSGAVGACPQIKNPISLARMVLDKSLVQLTLRRVPPNLLVGLGAVDFASEAGIPILPYDALVSPGARERWLRWSKDLERAEFKKRQQERESPWQFQYQRRPADPMQRDLHDNAARKAHADSMLRHANKRARTSESSPSSAGALNATSRWAFHMPQSTAAQNEHSETSEGDEGYIDVHDSPGSMTKPSSSSLINSSQDFRSLLTLSETSVVEEFAPSIEGSFDDRGDEDLIDDPSLLTFEQRAKQVEEANDSEDTVSTNSTLQLPSLSPSPTSGSITERDRPIICTAETISFKNRVQSESYKIPESVQPLVSTTFPAPETPSLPRASSLNLDSQTLPQLRQEDNITDTVGAIAVDKFGNIACGASSGGIGMKHRGRVGPAALVGVGAAVVPVHPNDKSKTCISCVTSGTGEHMGTTLAASVCADRLYSSMQKSKEGPLEPVPEEAVLRGFIEREFMMHPSVKNSNSTGAIGIISLKKSRDGLYLYFAHNTDSFALASMCSEDEEPVTAMSRTKGNASIAEGARSMRIRHKNT
ncbi:uncharacterized protein PV09_02972 [Verruconis gallopava]|uniref:N-terminal nucleophile aminohydrolase n=1 Tax=Verruconis gallopava TaxID=253628 RepID=A0A0D1Z0Q5_9PEZI|nr:uncharacterized protein PV09_02972 [Verruconis gallopava]KIW06542.1 hypothetical protein PV09_02972 [Verruconis gallopava]